MEGAGCVPASVRYLIGERRKVKVAGGDPIPPARVAPGVAPERM